MTKKNSTNNQAVMKANMANCVLGRKVVVAVHRLTSLQQPHATVSATSISNMLSKSY